MTKDDSASQSKIKAYNEVEIEKNMATIMAPFHAQMEPIISTTRNWGKVMADLTLPLSNLKAFQEAMGIATKQAQAIQESMTRQFSQELLEKISDLVKLNQENIKNMSKPLLACGYDIRLSSLSLTLIDNIAQPIIKSSLSIQLQSIKLATKHSGEIESTEAPVVATQIITRKQGSIEYRAEQETQGLLVAPTPEKLEELKKEIVSSMNDQELAAELEKRGGGFIATHIKDIEIQNGEHPTLIINDTQIKFDGSTKEGKFIKICFGRKRNWAKTIPNDTLRNQMMDKTIDDFLEPSENEKASKTVERCMRAINIKVGRALTGEANLLEPCKGGIRINPDLLKQPN